MAFTITGQILSDEANRKWDLSEIILRDDGSYVLKRVDLILGSSLYHVPNENGWTEMYAAVRNYVEQHPGAVHAECTPSLDELKAAKKAQIDAETSAAILSGFDYAVDGVTYYFSYDAFDQQNFADTANVCLMKQSGMPGLPDSVTWNAYMPGGELERLTFDASGFLALYAGGAMKHKNGTMQRGGERKAAVEAATTAEEVEAA